MLNVSGHRLTLPITSVINTLWWTTDIVSSAKSTSTTQCLVSIIWENWVQRGTFWLLQNTIIYCKTNFQLLHYNKIRSDMCNSNMKLFIYTVYMHISSREKFILWKVQGWKGHFETECSQKIDEPVWFSHIIGRSLERNYNKDIILRESFPRRNWQALYYWASSSSTTLFF